MKNIYLIIVLLTVYLPIMAQNEDDPSESSNKKFNTRGFYDNNFIVSRGNEIISEYDGNLMLEYVTKLNYPDNLSGDFSIVFNANVSHRIFMNENLNITYGNPYHSGYSINAPEWILGYKGIALQTLNFETNLYKPNDNIDNVDEYASNNLPPTGSTIGSEVPLLIPGYHYTNKLTDRYEDLNQSSCTISFYDIIHILRADGSTIELKNIEVDKTEGLYLETGKNKYGYAIVERIDNNYYENVARKMFYKPGDGLTYKFVEEFIRFGNCNDAVNKSNIYAPTIMYLTSISSPNNVMTFSYSFPAENSYNYGRKLFKSLSVNENIIDNYKNDLTVEYQFGNDNKLHALGIINNNSNDNLSFDVDAYANAADVLFSKMFYYNKTRRYRITKISDAIKREDNIVYIDNIRDFYYGQGGSHSVNYLFYLPSQITYFTNKTVKFEYWAKAFNPDDHTQNPLVFLDRFPKSYEANMSYAKRDCYTNFMLKKRELFNEGNNPVKTEVYSYYDDDPNDEWTEASYDYAIWPNIYTNVLIQSTENNENELLNKVKIVKNFSKINVGKINRDTYDYGSKIQLMHVTTEDASITNGKMIKTSYTYDYDASQNNWCDNRNVVKGGTFYPTKIVSEEYNDKSNSQYITKEINFTYGTTNEKYEELNYYWCGNLVKTKEIKKQHIKTDAFLLKTQQTYKNMFPTADLCSDDGSSSNLTYYFNLQLPEETKEYSDNIIKSHVKNFYGTSTDNIGRIIKTINHYGTDRETFESFTYNTEQFLGGFLTQTKNDKGAQNNYYYPTNQNGLLKASVDNKNIVQTDGTIHDELGFVHTGYQVKPFRTKTTYTSPQNNTIVELNKYSSYNGQNKLEFSIDYNGYYSDYFYDGIARIKNINLPGSFTSTITPFSDNITLGVHNYEIAKLNYSDIEVDNDDDVYIVQDYHYRSNDGSLTEDKSNKFYTYFENEIIPQNYNNSALFLEVQPSLFSVNEPMTFYIQGIATSYNGNIDQYGFGEYIDITLPESTLKEYINIAIDITNILDEYNSAGKLLYGIKITTRSEIIDPINTNKPEGTTNQRLFYIRGIPKYVEDYWETNNPNNYYIIIDGSEHSKSSYTYEYDDANLLVLSKANFIKDENDNSSKEQKDEFDALGQLRKSKVKNSSGSYIAKKTMNYNYQGLVSETETATGIKTTKEYNFLGNLTKTQLETLNPGTIEYNWKEGYLTNGSHTVHYYKKNIYKDAENKIRTEYFDKIGNKVAEQLDTNPVTIFQYDDIYQLVKVISPEGKETIYEYDELGYLKSKTTPDESKYEYKYDKWGNLRFKYQPPPLPEDIVDITYYTYDVLNRPLATGITTGGFVDFNNFNPDVEEPFDNDESKMVVKNMYDNYERTGVFSSLPPHNSENMNIKGRLTATAFRDKPGDVWNYKIYHYDYLGRVKWFQVKYGDNGWKDITNEYDHQGNLVKQNINGDHHIWNEYDLQSRLTNVKSNKENNYTTAITEVKYDYNSADQITKIGDFSLPLGETNYLYNNKGWVESIANKQNSSSTNRFLESLEYYENGNISSQNITNKGELSWLDLSFDYSYDGLNRLTESISSDDYYSRHWTYDNDGNILNWIYPAYGEDVGYFYSYNNNNNQLSRITQHYGSYPNGNVITVDRLNYDYDTKGRLTLKSTNEQASPMSFTRYVDQNFTYNYLNLPTQVNEYDGPGNYYYYYDEQGNRISRRFNSGSSEHEYYLRDHTGRAVAVYDMTINKIKLVNLYGNGKIGNIKVTWSQSAETDAQIIWERTSDERFYYIKDHLGSIRQVVDQNGDISSARDYYPYGSILREYTVGDDEKYKFTEKERDKETDFDYFGARYYDSDIGRWTTVDPLASKYPGWSPYNYTLCNPLNRIDPDGLSSYVFQYEVRVVAKFVTAALNAGLAIDDKGNYGVFIGGSLGGAVGAGVVGGFNISVFPSSHSYDDIGDFGLNIGGFLAGTSTGPGGALGGEANLLLNDAKNLGTTLGLIPGTSYGYGGGAYVDVSNFQFLSKTNPLYKFIMNYFFDKISSQLDMSNEEIIQYLTEQLKNINEENNNDEKQKNGRTPMLDASGEPMEW